MHISEQLPLPPRLLAEISTSLLGVSPTSDHRATGVLADHIASIDDNVAGLIEFEI